MTKKRWNEGKTLLFHQLILSSPYLCRGRMAHGWSQLSKQDASMWSHKHPSISGWCSHITVYKWTICIQFNEVESIQHDLNVKSPVRKENTGTLELWTRNNYFFQEFNNAVFSNLVRMVVEKIGKLLCFPIWAGLIFWRLCKLARS